MKFVGKNTIKKYTNYAIVSAYVAMPFGKSRVAENIDILQILGCMIWIKKNLFKE